MQQDSGRKRQMIALIKLIFFTGIGILAFASLAEALHINLWIGIAAFILAALASAHQQQAQQRRLQEEVERTTAELQQAQQRHRAAQQVLREAEQDLRDATNHRKTVQYLLNATLHLWGIAVAPHGVQSDDCPCNSVGTAKHHRLRHRGGHHDGRVRRLRSVRSGAGAVRGDLRARTTGMKSSDFVDWIKKFEDFPLFTPKPAPMDDADIAFHSDIQYLHLLLDDIWENAYYSGGTAKLDPVFIDFMATMSAAMNAMTKAIAVSNAALNLFLVDWRESIKAVTL